MPRGADFKANGSFIVVNDCYGIGDTGMLVAETGTWKLDQKQNLIIVRNRKFPGNYYSWGRASTLKMYVRSVSNKLLRLSLDNKRSAPERYERIQD
jgi:hypothetical protein